jgi:hypothetical protein
VFKKWPHLETAIRRQATLELTDDCRKGVRKENRSWALFAANNEPFRSRESASHRSQVHKNENGDPNQPLYRICSCLTAYICLPASQSSPYKIQAHLGFKTWIRSYWQRQALQPNQAAQARIFFLGNTLAPIIALVKNVAFAVCNVLGGFVSPYDNNALNGRNFFGK